MKLEFLLLSNIKTLQVISKHFSMSPLLLFGKILVSRFSIVMEYADNGDVFQKICDH